MVDNQRAFFSDKNDIENLLEYVEKKDYVYVRDRPAIDHLVYWDYKDRKTRVASEERLQCPFAVSKKPFLTRKRTFAYSNDFKYSSLFDPE